LKIKTSKPKVIWKAKTFLGEGVLWVPSHKKVYFVDIKKKKIFIFNTLNNRKSIIKVNKEIGFLAHIRSNIFILGLKGELRIINLRSKKIIKSIDIEKKKLNNRLNDGKVDPAGRLWFGTMDNLERNIKNGSLYCLDRSFNLRKVDSNYIITNGPAFVSKNIFYHTDSRLKKVYKIRINNNYKIINKKIFIRFSKNDGSPDGMTLDSQKNLWICHYGGSCISVYNKDGKKIHNVYFPTKNITNCVFGGKRNSELFVTSAIKSKNKLDKQQFKYSGCLFSIQTNTNGLYQKNLIIKND
jgi:sugar lactone lactonase YvrE